MAVAKIYGAKGRALEEAVPPGLSFPRFYRGGVNHIVDSAAFADTNEVGSTCWLGRLPSHAVINPASTIYNGAFGTNCTLNIGDGNDVDGLATLIAVASGGNSVLLEAITAQNYVRELWQHLSYAKDPERMIDLYATTAGASVSTSTAWLTWNILFSVR